MLRTLLPTFPDTWPVDLDAEPFTTDLHSHEGYFLENLQFYYLYLTELIEQSSASFAEIGLDTLTAGLVFCMFDDVLTLVMCVVHNSGS